MKIVPNKQWLELYKTKRQVLVPVSDLNSYFTAAEIAGQREE